MKLPHFPWMKNVKLSYEDFYIELEMRKNTGNTHSGILQRFWRYFRVPTNSGNSEQEERLEIKIENIFEINANNITVLVEGEAGFGKTSLTMKLAYDWAMNKSYMKYFHLVFVIPLRNLDKKVIQYVRDEYFSEEELLQFQSIANSEEVNVLLLFDGYDEVKAEHKKHLLDVLNNRLTFNAHVLLTSRPGKFAEERKNIFRTSEINAKKFNKRIFIKSLGEDHQEYFLLKHLSEEKKQYKELLKQSLLDIPNELRVCPMTLLMVGILIKEKDSTLILSKTELYTQIINMMINSWVKKEKNYPSNIDILEERTSNNAVFNVNSLKDFGECALKCLKDQNYVIDSKTFDPKEIKDVISMGFIYKNQKQLHSQDVYYDPIHKSFLEYLAAFNLWSKRLENDFRSVIHETMTSYHLFDLNSSLLLHFLFGLFSNDVLVLITALTPLAYYYSFNIHQLWPLLKQFDINEELISFLEPFIPVYWKMTNSENKSDFLTSKLHEKLMERGTKIKQIRYLEWDLGIDVNLPEKISVERFELLTFSNFVSSTNSELSRQIECNELYCVLQCSEKHSLDEHWKSILKIIDNVKWNCISFQVLSLEEETMQLILDTMKEGQLQKKKMHSYSMELKKDMNLAFATLITMIKVNGFQNIFIRLVDDEIPDTRITQKLPEFSRMPEITQNDVDRLLSSIACNDNVKGFTFDDLTSTASFVVDMNSFTNNGTKEFHHLWFYAIKLINSGNASIKYKIDAMLINGISINDEASTKALSSCATTTISFHSLHFIIDEKSFDSSLVTELHLVQSDNLLTHFTWVQKLHNLQKITLCLTSSLKKEYSLQQIESFFSVIFSLKLTSVEIEQIEKNPSFAFNLVTKLSEILISMNPFSSKGKPNTKPFNLVSFRLAVNIHWINPTDLEAVLDQVREMMEKMAEPLRRGACQQFSLLFSDPSNLKPQFPLCLAEIFPAFEGFNIQWDLDANTKEGSTLNKIFSKHRINSYNFFVSYETNEIKDRVQRSID